MIATLLQELRELARTVDQLRRSIENRIQEDDLKKQRDAWDWYRKEDARALARGWPRPPEPPFPDPLLRPCWESYVLGKDGTMRVVQKEPLPPPQIRAEQ